MNTSESAFRQQLIAALPALRRYCYALTSHPQNAEDLLQASVERALNRWQQYQVDSHFDRWLYRLCRNYWIDTMRKQKPSETWDEEQDYEQQTLSTEQVHSANAALNKVQAHMQKLNEAMRSVLYLVAVEGRSYQEAADILNVPIGTVMSRLTRARQQLSRSVGDI
jgi:RNA polymerase sigma-70 factor (ECF subfamily)